MVPALPFRQRKHIKASTYYFPGRGTTGEDRSTSISRTYDAALWNRFPFSGLAGTTTTLIARCTTRSRPPLSSISAGFVRPAPAPLLIQGPSLFIHPFRGTRRAVLIPSANRTRRKEYLPCRPYPRLAWNAISPVTNSTPAGCSALRTANPYAWANFWPWDQGAF